jgi:hypothetical protein
MNSIKICPRRAWDGRSFKILKKMMPAVATVRKMCCFIEKETDTNNFSKVLSQLRINKKNKYQTSLAKVRRMVKMDLLSKYSKKCSVLLT